MSIKITGPGGKKKPTYKLISALCTYMFEQEFGDLRGAEKEDLDALKKAIEALNRIARR